MALVEDNDERDLGALLLNGEDYVMFTTDPKPQPQDPKPAEGTKTPAPEKEKPPYQFDDWALI